MEKDFATITRSILEAYGLSEAQLAERLKVSQPTIHRLKTGESTRPSYVLGVQLVELFESRPSSPEAA